MNPSATVPRFVDTHVHLDDAQFRNEVDAVIDRGLAAGVQAFINIAYRPESWLASVQLAALRPEVKVAFGLHPNSAGLWNDALLDALAAVIETEQPVAIGESGLDYFRSRADREMQIAAFTAQIDLALAFDLPLILHLRGDVEADALDILTPQNDRLRCVLHAFDGTPELGAFAIERGWHFGIGGMITKMENERLRSIVCELPLDLLLLETDAPYLAPKGSASRRNEPENLAITMRTLAEIRTISEHSIAETTTRNASQLFGLSTYRDSSNLRELAS